MHNDYQKLSRGQVWWVDPGNVIGSVEKKKRTMLVVSNDLGNATANTAIVIPITSQLKPPLAVNVEFNTAKGRMTILCNQITTVDQSQIFEYAGTVSDYVMREVDKAVAYATGMQKTNVLLKDIQNSIESIFKEYLVLIEAEKCCVTVDDIIDDLNFKLTKMKSVVNQTVVENLSIEKDIVRNPEDLCSEGSIGNENDNGSDNDFQEEQPKSIKNQYKSRNFWTEDNIIQFLIDCEKLPTNKVMEKWNIKNKTTLWTYKTKFKKAA